MASLVKKYSRRLRFMANTPHFFKIILNNTIRDGKLGIPRKFVRKYGDYLSSPVLLKVCNGAVWKVELTKCDGEIWLQKGWQEFVDYYSLAYGHLLVFELHQKISSHFNVMIFDKSASEIDYPYSSITNGDNEKNLGKKFQKPEVEETETDATIEILDETLASCLKTKGESPLPFPQNHKMMKTDDSTLHCHRRKVEGKRGYGSMSCQEQTSDSDGIVVKKQKLSKKEKTRALCEASANFASTNPYFMVVMQPSYVFSSKDRMAMPASFALKHLEQKEGDAFLSVLNGRNWSIRYYMHNSASNTIAKFTNGWGVFARDNQLEVGNVCAFEMIKSTKITFKVSIFRYNEGNKKHLIDGESSNSPSAIEAAKEFRSVHPLFKVVIATGHLEHCKLHVPGHFIMNINQSSVNCKLQVDDRCWPVKLNNYQHPRHGQLSAGWYAFARQNSLQVKDVCIFELIDRETMLIKVTIFRNVKSD